MASGDEGRLRDVVTEVVGRAGYDLEELLVRSAGRRMVVKVVIDADDGVTLDAAADVSRAISARLDEAGDADPTGSAPYTLEVTSPGVGRPLTLPRHFRRARTRLVALTTNNGTQLTGHVLAVDDATVTMVLSGRRGTSQQQIPIADIAGACVEVEFSPPPAAVLHLLGVTPPVEPDDDVITDPELDDQQVTDDSEDADDIDDFEHTVEPDDDGSPDTNGTTRAQEATR